MTFIRLPRDLLRGPGEPDVVLDDRVGELRRLVTGQGGTVAEVDISAARASGDVVRSLKEVLPFPEWCGSNWDSVEDAFAELAEAWPFPLVLLVYGLPHLVRHELHLALQTALRLGTLADGFATAQRQLRPVYVEP